MRSVFLYFYNLGGCDMCKVEEKSYSVDDVIGVIERLSHSQGFYGRLLQSIIEMKKEDPSSFEEFKNTVESQEFKSDLDVVLFFET